MLGFANATRRAQNFEIHKNQSKLIKINENNQKSMKINALALPCGGPEALNPTLASEQWSDTAQSAFSSSSPN